MTFISTDHALLGHVIDVCTGNDLVCGLQCLRNDKCRSYNCLAAENQSTEVCHLSNETRTSRPEDFKGNHGTTYFELMQVYISLMLIKMKRTMVVFSLGQFWLDIVGKVRKYSENSSY